MDDAVGQGSAVPVRAFRPSSAVIEAGYSDEDFSTYPEFDFGPLRVRVPPQAGVRMSTEEVYSDAVYFDFPSGSVRLSLFAAPRSSPLWPSRAEEIAGIQAGIGAQVSSVWGEWGRELHIVHNGEYNWVTGVDGSRWMLLGRASWTTDPGWELVDVMRSMIRHARVERGAEPMPVRAPLGLRRPGAAAEDDAPDAGTPYAAVVTMRQDTPPEPDDLPDDLPDDFKAADVAAAHDEPAPQREPGAVVPAPLAGAPDQRSPITPGRGLAAAAAVLAVVAGCLWLTRESPVPDPGAPAALPAPVLSDVPGDAAPGRSVPAAPGQRPPAVAGSRPPAGAAPARPVADGAGRLDPGRAAGPGSAASGPTAADRRIDRNRAGAPDRTGPGAAGRGGSGGSDRDGGGGSGDSDDDRSEGSDRDDSDGADRDRPARSRGTVPGPAGAGPATPLDAVDDLGGGLLRVVPVVPAVPAMPGF